MKPTENGLFSSKTSIFWSKTENSQKPCRRHNILINRLCRFTVSSILIQSSSFLMLWKGLLLLSLFHHPWSLGYTNSSTYSQRTSGHINGWLPRKCAHAASRRIQFLRVKKVIFTKKIILWVQIIWLQK
jgi:hypothetical protein